MQKTLLPGATESAPSGPLNGEGSQLHVIDGSKCYVGKFHYLQPYFSEGIHIHRLNSYLLAAPLLLLISTTNSIADPICLFSVSQPTGTACPIVNTQNVNALTNSGTMSLTGGFPFYYLINNYQGGMIGSVTNNGAIISDWKGIQNAGIIDNVFNNGSINSLGSGIANSNFIGTLLNASSITSGIGQILAANSDFSAISNGGLISILTNNGTIVGGTDGISNDTDYGANGRITTLTNNGTITGGTGSYGIRNQGTITTLNNAQNGLTYTGVLPTNYNVILNSTTAFGRLVGTNVTGSSIFGLSNLSSWTPSNYTFTGVLQGLTASNVNSSSLTGTFNGYAWSLFLETGSSNVWDLKLTQICPFPLNQAAGGSCVSGSSIQAGQIGDVINAGTIDLSSRGFTNEGTISNVTNSGTITGAGWISNLGTITSLSNSGTMSYIANKNLYWMFDSILNEKTIGSIYNTGLMSSDWKLIGNIGNINTINNVGSMRSYGANISNGIVGSQIGVIGSLTNTGSITSGVGGVLAQNSDFAAIQNGSLITTLINSGTISGGTDGISNDTEYGSNGRITTLTNTGTIAGGTGSYGIRNQGTITTLNNAQNGLTYTGVLPTNYNIILNSTSAFGRLVGTNVKGCCQW